MHYEIVSLLLPLPLGKLFARVFLCATRTVTAKVTTRFDGKAPVPPRPCSSVSIIVSTVVGGGLLHANLNGPMSGLVNFMVMVGRFSLYDPQNKGINMLEIQR
jgi:hypothetical protein